MAQQLLDRADPATAGLWPRAAALLARQALEQGLDDYWRERGLALDEFGTRPQLICLREYLDDPVLAGRARHTWAALSEACHHHPYELAPGHGELAAWIDTVGELLPELGGPEAKSVGETRLKREGPEPGRSMAATPQGRRSKCPSCGSQSVAEILRGMPAWSPELDRDLDSGRTVLGGCIVSGDDPDLRCNKCGHAWRRKPPANRRRRGLL